MEGDETRTLHIGVSMRALGAAKVLIEELRGDEREAVLRYAEKLAARVEGKALSASAALLAFVDAVRQRRHLEPDPSGN